MSDPCQTCGTEYDVFICEQCENELCMDCSVEAFDYTRVCKCCEEKYNQSIRDKHTELYHAAMQVLNGGDITVLKRPCGVPE